ncbi:sigma-70 family RNA polymerase sigma factor [Kribbella sandramycini]|uniref:DNA-directed RNA polymerase specialized sigma24 family protein n=1 Tax=Kribbella sandramycini TaxID=60450 RepID=A0A7Y4L3F3_9ACTN|nr:sigma-70 family RNA polymerase sigma factor [Kribbella sandramycini]MBB6570962.1 DNA-directed RNA polymerase specialized sigma24 family protein [Kribbella sandramycini]NOL43628.1 sigma-70 family RNA polymerase sigma factor [Kribbella sandramycini]
MDDWFATQVERHGPDIHAYLSRRTADGVADDLLGEVWVAAYGGHSGFDPDLGTPRAWLFGVAALAPQLRAALRELPAVERELLLLVAWEQLSPTEAAEVLGIPAGTARSRLHRARQRMDERLGGSAEALATAAHRVAAVADRRRTGHRRVLVPAAAATATATAVVAVVALQQAGGPAARPVAPVSSPAPSPGKAISDPGVAFSCAVDYSMAELARRDFGIDGTVVSAVRVPRTVGAWAVTFEVNEWFRPATRGDRLTVQMWIGPGRGRYSSVYETGYEIGDRLLIAGSLVDSRTGKPLKYPSGGACGFGRTYDEGTAATWRTVLSKLLRGWRSDRR